MAIDDSIDPALLEKALEIGDEKTQKAVVTQALVEYIARRETAHLKELFGQLNWNSGFDYKSERERSETTVDG